jgi:acetylornithine deacetylase
MKSSAIADLLSDLVSIPSVNPMGGEKRVSHSACMIEYLERWFTQRGITCHRQAVAGGEDNLIATTTSPANRSTVVFDAHTDTVPVEGWENRAFTPRRENGRIYGRGSCDTKASMTAMIAAMSDLCDGPPVPQTIVFLASADEEYGRTGVRTFLSENPKIDYAVVGEPTCCQPVTACKGAVRFELVVRGRSAHSSTPQKGVNAIVRMASAIQLLEEYARTVLPKKTHLLVDGATLTSTVIRGGSAVNVVPDVCRLSVDLRTMPNEKPTEALAEVQSFLKQRLKFSVEYESVQLWDGADLAVNHPFVTHCATSCREVLGPKVPVQPQGVNYGCHASDYSVRGIPAVVLGPGDIAVAHTIDEYVEIDSVCAAAEIYRRIMSNPIT